MALDGTEGVSWPPNYLAEFKRRTKLIRAAQRDPDVAQTLKAHYQNNCVDFINDWCVTYDPRKQPPDPKMMPFILFPKQVEFVEYVLDCWQSGEDGLLEKCRDMGASWICAGISVWMWLFHDHASVGWGSRKEEYVDKIGDPKSVFHKIRQIIDYLPPFLRPPSYNPKIHSNHLKIVNPENGATITGEAGDNIGRGNRTGIYFLDEAAHVERPELIEASLGDTTDCRIDLSSVNGVGNVFYNRRHAGEVWTPGHSIRTGVTRVFIMDWRDHPDKDQEWYDRRKEKAKREGLLHKFLQEIDRDYASSVKGLLIEPKWFKAAIGAAQRLGIEVSGKTYVALDVGDSEDGDPWGLTARKGIELIHASEWASADPGESTKTALGIVKRHDATDFLYDGIGVGAGVKAEVNRMLAEESPRKRWPKNCTVAAWIASSTCLRPNSRMIPSDPLSMKNKDYFPNLKAQGCWELRRRFEKTYNAIEKGEKFDPDELISISPDLENIHEVERQICQPTFKENGAGKLVINKKPNNAKSPGMFDAAMMGYHPVKPPKLRF